jgi:hypothetical protein
MDEQIKREREEIKRDAERVRHEQAEVKELLEKVQKEIESDDESDDLVRQFGVPPDLILRRNMWVRGTENPSEGSTALVYKGLLKENQRPIAIKTFSTGIISAEEEQNVRETFFSEEKQMERISDCNHVIGLFGITKHRNRLDKRTRYSLIMELAERSLKSLLREKKSKKEKLPDFEKCKYALEIAQGIFALHHAKSFIVI